MLENWKKSQGSEKRKSLETLQFQDLFLGGDKRDRTADLLNAIQALSQRSYTPILTFDTDFWYTVQVGQPDRTAIL